MAYSKEMPIVGTFAPVMRRPQQQQQQPEKKKRGLLATWLPTATSIIGGAAGTFLAPGAGTAVGGALGGGVGEWLAQRLSGEKSNVGKIGLEAGFGALGGIGKAAKSVKGASEVIRAGEGIKDAASVLRYGDDLVQGLKLARNAPKTGLLAEVAEAGTKRGASVLQRGVEGARNAGKEDVARRIAGFMPKDLRAGMGFADEAASTVTRNPGKVQGWLTKKADDLSSKSIRVTPSQATKFESKTGTNVGEFVRKNKLFGQSADEIRDGIVRTTDKEFADLVKNIKRPITTKDIVGANKDDIAKLLKSDVPELRQKGQAIVDGLNQVLTRNGGKIDPTKLNSIKAEYASLVNYSTKLANPAKASVNEGISKAMRKTLQAADETGRLKEVGLKSRDSRMLADIVESQANLGKGAGSIGLRDMLAMGAGAGAGGVPGAATGIVANRVANSPKVASFVAGQLAKAGERGAGKVVDNSVKGAVKGMVKAQAVPRLLQRGAEGATPPVQQDPAATQGDYTDQAYEVASLLGGMGIGSPMAEQPEQSSGTTYGRDQLFADLNRDPKNADKYMSLYSMLAKEDAASGKSSTKKTESQRARDEAQALTEKAIQQFQGGSIETGPISTRIEKAKAFFNKGDQETLDFNTTISSLQAAIAKARAGTSFTPNEQRLLNQYAPKVGDSGQILQTKLMALQDIYAQAAQREAGTEYQPDMMTNPYDMSTLMAGAY